MQNDLIKKKSFMKTKMMKTLFWGWMLLCLSVIQLHAQVTIGSGIEPIGGALLDLKEKNPANPATDNTTATRGMLLPRVNLTGLNKLYPMFATGYAAAEDAKHTGLTVYNLKQCDGQFARGVYTWTGAEWVQLTNNPVLTASNPVLTFPAALVADNYLVSIPSGQDLRPAWTSAYAPEISYINAGSVTGAWANTVGGGLAFSSHALAPSFPATWNTSPISNIYIWPEEMTAAEVAANPFRTRESKLTVKGIAGGSPCPGDTTRKGS
jgi:hypothetical protein